MEGDDGISAVMNTVEGYMDQPIWTPLYVMFGVFFWLFIYMLGSF